LGDYKKLQTPDRERSDQPDRMTTFFDKNKFKDKQ